jgi:hypothetical protein
LAEQDLEIYEAISQIYMLCNTLHEYKTVKSYHVLNAELNAINILFFFLIIAKKNACRFSSDPETTMGLVQHEGGPCGVLATVQV